MRGGARLYSDIVEINPPLWFWMAMPLDWLAATLAIPSEKVAFLAIAGLALASLAACSRLLDDQGGSAARAAFLAYLVAVLIAMPARQFEQREQLVLIGAVPYLVLAAIRHQRRPVNAWLAGAVGIGAGLGLALKPYFLAVPALTELWLLSSLRRNWLPFRHETAATGAVLLAYAAAMALLTPAYFTVTLPMLMVGYYGVGAKFLSTIGFLPIIWLCTMVAVLSQWRSTMSKPPLTIAFLLGGFGFAIAWAAQHKGWLYQGVPATGCFALALAAILYETGGPANRFARICSPALLLLPLSFAAVDAETRITPENNIASALTELRPGDTLGFVGRRGITTWPAAVGRGLRLSSRYGQYWMLNALDERPDDPAARALVTRSIRETALDYRCLPPKLILFLHVAHADPARPASSNPYRLFARDPEFAKVLAHYRLWRSAPIYDAYKQVSPLQPVDPRRCRNPG